jgi:hypothetical protein
MGATHASRGSPARETLVRRERAKRAQQAVFLGVPRKSKSNRRLLGASMRPWMESNRALLGLEGSGWFTGSGCTDR